MQPGNLKDIRRLVAQGIDTNYKTNTSAYNPGGSKSNNPIDLTYFNAGYIKSTAYQVAHTKLVMDADVVDNVYKAQSTYGGDIKTIVQLSKTCQLLAGRTNFPDNQLGQQILDKWLPTTREKFKTMQSFKAITKNLQDLAEAFAATIELMSVKKTSTQAVDPDYRYKPSRRAGGKGKDTQAYVHAVITAQFTPTYRGNVIQPLFHITHTSTQLPFHGYSNLPARNLYVRLPIDANLAGLSEVNGQGQHSRFKIYRVQTYDAFKAVKQMVRQASDYSKSKGVIGYPLSSNPTLRKFIRPLFTQAYREATTGLGLAVQSKNLVAAHKQITDSSAGQGLGACVIVKNLLKNDKRIRMMKKTLKGSSFYARPLGNSMTDWCAGKLKKFIMKNAGRPVKGVNDQVMGTLDKLQNSVQAHVSVANRIRTYGKAPRVAGVAPVGQGGGGGQFQVNPQQQGGNNPALSLQNLTNIPGQQQQQFDQFQQQQQQPPQGGNMNEEDQE